MKTLIVRDFSLPEEAEVVDVSTFHITTIRQNDTIVERLVLYMKGKNVQIFRYDGDNCAILVSINGWMNEMDASCVEGYLREHV